MTKTEVEQYLDGSEHPLTAALSELCDVIRGVDPRIDESIKWNAPSFFIADHFATTGFAPGGALRLVLHTGAKKRAQPLKIVIDGGDGLLEWKGGDRAIATFRSVDEVRAARQQLISVLAQWSAQTQSE